MKGFLMDKAIITGATSMLGLALIGECIKNNTPIVAIVREDSKKNHLIPNNDLVTTVGCDVSAYKSLHMEKENGSAVFYHFAWEATANAERDQIDLQSRNIGYTLDSLDLAKRIGCKRFIGAGSQAEYGRVEGAISPEFKVSPDSAYGVAKYSAGKLASIQAEQMGMDFIWTRIFSVYGINDTPTTLVVYCIDCFLRGVEPLLTRCEQQWDYLNCLDVARAFYLIGEKGQNQSMYNIGSGIARPLLEYVQIIRDTINPGLPIGIGKRDYSPKQVMHLCADITSLKAHTGFSPVVSFEDGIRETIEWVKVASNENY